MIPNSAGEDTMFYKQIFIYMKSTAKQKIYLTSLFTKGSMYARPPPLWFNCNHPGISKLNKKEIEKCDECHIEQQGHKDEHEMVQCTFKQDKHGQFSYNSEYTKVLLTKIVFKYPELGRFLFSVVYIMKLNLGVLDGVCMDGSNYST